MIFRTDKNEFEIKEAIGFIEKHKMARERYEKLQKYYETQHDILKNPGGDSKPNYKVVNAYPRYITDMLTGYFVGQPIRYSNKANASDNDLQSLIDAFNYTDESAHNLEVAKTCSIKGKSFEIVYADTSSKPRLALIQPDEMFCVYDETLENNIVYAVRAWEKKRDNKNITHAEIYTKTEIIQYEIVGKEASETNRVTHHFKDVPVIEFRNNQEELGDFEHVLTLVDAYDKAQSNTLNDMEQFTDSYLMLVNLSGTEDKDITKMKRDRILLLNDKGQAAWLTKEVNDAWVENYKTRLKQDIHKFSATPDMSDKEFGSNLSGVSLRYKLLAMEQVRSGKERQFRKGLQRRIELFYNFLKLTKSVDTYTGIDIQFSNTLPQNVYELSQTIQNLLPIVSKETLLSQLPFINSATEEMARFEEETLNTLSDYNDQAGNNNEIE